MGRPSGLEVGGYHSLVMSFVSRQGGTVTMVGSEGNGDVNSWLVLVYTDACASRPRGGGISLVVHGLGKICNVHSHSVRYFTAPGWGCDAACEVRVCGAQSLRVLLSAGGHLRTCREMSRAQSRSPTVAHVRRRPWGQSLYRP